MKPKVLLYFSFISLIFLSVSCVFIGPSVSGDGNVTEETRVVEPFDEVSVSRGINVYLQQGEETKLRVVADENLLDAIETHVEGGTLKVTTSKWIRRSTSKKVYVTTPDIKGIGISAGSNVYTETVLHSKDLEIKASAGSNAKLQVDADYLDVRASSGSNVNIEGKTNSFTARVSSGANIRGEDLVTNDFEGRASSGANLWVTVNRDFDGKASSGANVFYYGNPKSVNMESSSGGNVIKK